jgi:threonine/homoserine efflux transporter RhtA
MKFEVDFSQPSTIRGLVWVAVAVIGLVMIAFGKDVSQLIVLGAGVAGGLGVAIKD